MKNNFISHEFCELWLCKQLKAAYKLKVAFNYPLKSMVWKIIWIIEHQKLKVNTQNLDFWSIDLKKGPKKTKLQQKKMNNRVILWQLSLS